MPVTDSGGRGGSLLVRWLIRVGTMLVSAGILLYFLRDLDWDSLKKAMGDAELVPAFLGAVLPLFIFWVTDAAFTVKSFAWFHRPVRFFDYLVIKAAAYLLTMINLAFSTSGTFLYFMRKTGVSASHQAGLLLWRILAAVSGALVFFMVMTVFLLVFFREDSAGAGFEIWGPVMAAGGLIFLDFFVFWFRGGGLVMKNLPFDYEGEFWKTFREAGPRQWLWGWAYTVPPIIANFVGLYVAARAFHLEVPFIHFIFWIPLAAVVSALPVAFGAVGTTTAAWAFAFSDFGGQEHIWAVTVFIPIVRLVTRAVMGLVAMPLATRELESLNPKKGGAPGGGGE